jgi:signal-transduction protein with cAMP-binding, CBS, and nucleotidyltransferase domain
MDTTRDILARKGRGVVAIEPTASIVSCARRMSDNGIGSVVVMEDERMLGIVTRQDLVEVVARRGDAISRLTAQDVMSRDLQTSGLDTPFVEVEQLMIRHHVKHLPVLEADSVVGIITRIDVLQRHLEQASGLNDDLAAYIQGVYPR